MTTKISSDNIQASSLATIGGGPRIANIQVTNASYVPTGANTVSTFGGYIKVNGAKFNTGAQVFIGTTGTTAATSISVVDSTQLNVQVPAQAQGKYDLYVINTDGTFGLRPIGLEYAPVLIPVDYLIVAGGGGGGGAKSGTYEAGGGGAGGLLRGNANLTATVTYSVVIGGGGTGGNQSAGTAGSNTTALSLLAYGGGFGSGISSGGPGGSGGGAYGDLGGTAGKGVYPGSTFVSDTRQGYDGGQGGGAGGTPGGGGGAGGVGGNAANAGVGGVGIQWQNGIFYAGGGGGTSGNAFHGGGTGGGRLGGNGGTGNVNTGGGGGAGWSVGSTLGGAGGSGVVILRYPNTYANATTTTGAPTFSESGGFKYYTFTGSGSITI